MRGEEVGGRQEDGKKGREGEQVCHGRKEEGEKEKKGRREKGEVERRVRRGVREWEDAGDGYRIQAIARQERADRNAQRTKHWEGEIEQEEGDAGRGAVVEEEKEKKN